MTGAGLSRQAALAAYKKILRDYIDQRPSGMRQKIAQVLGTHKSFISQISNPNDPTPIPARHLEAIIDVCHLSAQECEQFLAAYRSAHPNQTFTPSDGLHVQRAYKTLHLQVPVLEDVVKQQELELLIKETVQRLYRLLGDNL